MTKTSDDDILGGKAKGGERKKRDTYYKRKNRGGLHEIITRGLPMICGPDGVANLHKLGEKLEMTYAGIHKWMPPNGPHLIPPRRADEIIAMSVAYAKKHPKFKPVTKADFLPYF